MRLRRLIKLVAVLLGVFVPGIASAQTDQVRLGIYRPEVHNGIQIDELNQREYAVGMFAAAAKAVNLTFDGTAPLKDNDEVAGLKSGLMQFVGPVPIVEMRLKRMDMTTPILIAKGAAFYKAGTPRLSHSDQLKGKRVGVAMWGAGQQWCLERQVPVLVKGSLEEALRDLQDGKLDVVITTEIAGAMAVEKLKLGGIKRAVLEDGKILRAYAFASLPENSVLRAKIDEGLRLIRLSGEADALYDRYVAPYQARDAGAAVSYKVAITVAGLLLAASAAGALAFVSTRNRLKRRSADLLESQEQYRLMTENLSGVTYRYLQEESGRRIMLSTNSLFAIWQEVFPDLRLENGFGEGMFQAVHPDDVARLKEAVAESKRIHSPLEVEFRLIDVNKVYHWIHARSFASKHPQGVVWQGILFDVTHQRHLATSLYESEVKFQEIVEHCHEGILAVNRPSGMVAEANSAAASMLHMQREDLLGRSICLYMPELREAIEAVDGANVVELKFSLQAQGEETRELEVRMKAMEFPGRKASVIVIRDVTVRERLARERARIDAEMVRTQKLEGLGVMAGGIAHDFNNILVGILGNLSLAQRQVETTSPIHKTLQLVERAAGRAADLTSKLLAYSGGTPTERVAFDLGEQVLSSQDHLRVAAGRNSELVLSVSAGAIGVVGDPIQIEQVLVNLVRNAAEAITHEYGKIEITLDTTRLDGSRPENLIGSDVPPAAEFAKLSVKDNGSGIAPEILQRMFEPFVTTKFAGRGLGLASCIGIVRAHRGYLCINTELGTGTEFIVLLPSSLQPANQVVEPKSLKPEFSKPRERTILVVDDESLVRITLRSMLKLISAHSIEAESGEVAIEILRAGAVPDCVLLDMTMPGKSGLKTLQEIRSLLPRIPVILCSGFSQQALTPQLAADPNLSFLSKPYTVDELTAQIERMTAQVPNDPVSM